ncbi:MAG: metal-binding protein [Roseiflexus sp.]|nr:MAG: metal-binding protein [Roseiflexus sp.]
MPLCVLCGSVVQKTAESPYRRRMPDTPTHDIITVATSALLAPATYALLESSGRDYAATGATVLTGAHLISGLLFSPDLDIDSAIDDRWGIFFWIWRPYMWIIPHRHFWSHSLIIAPLLRLVYFSIVTMLIVIWGTWLLGYAGLGSSDLHAQAPAWIFDLMRRNPDMVRLFLFGFISGSAAHTIADWLVTGGRRYLHLAGIRLRSDYRNHDRARRHR